MRILFAVLSIVYVGDSLTQANPGYVQNGERAVTYHISDSILWIEESGHYDRIVLELGIHAIHGSDRLYYNNPDLFRRRYAQLLDTALSHAGEVVVINIPWLDWPAAKIERAILFNQIIKEECDQRGIYYIDAWTIIETCGLACIGEDGFHPSQAGYDLIRAALPKVRYYLPIVWRTK